MTKTRAEQLAFTLNFIVKEGHVPGLLPEQVTEAADLVVAQEKELTTLRAALAAKHHTVNVTVTPERYRSKIRAEFVIADPRLYYAEITVDDRMAALGAPSDWVLHIARQLVSVGTAEWVRELQEQAWTAIMKAQRQAA